MAITQLSERHETRKSRNVGLGFCLGGFVVMVLVLSMIKIAVEIPAQRAAQAEQRALEAQSSSGKFTPAPRIPPKEEVR